jgi:hypothetical protein
MSGLRLGRLRREAWEGGGAMSDLLTTSRLRAYRKCSRLEFFLYVKGWRPVRDDDNLAFGTLWHCGMDAWWAAHMQGRPADALADTLAVVAGRAADVWAQIRCEEMLRGYDAKWSGQTFTIVGIEDEFRAPLINPESFQPSRTWRLGGKIDKRIEHNGRRLLVDHKTSSEDISAGADYWLKLAMDHQISNYVIGCESLGWPPEGFLYDVALKSALRPLSATPIETRKFKKDGTLYAAQREHDETPDEYRVRVREALDVDPDRYFVRYEVPRTESQLAEFLQDAHGQAKMMRHGHLTGRAPRNPEACFAYGRCPFWTCCSTGSSPADHPDLYRRIEHVHPELTAENAAEVA